MTIFEVEFHRDGVLAQKFTVPADTTRGLMPVPSADALRQFLSRPYHGAITRGSWERSTYASKAVPLRMSMASKAGKDLGTLIAKEL